MTRTWPVPLPPIRLYLVGLFGLSVVIVIASVLALAAGLVDGVDPSLLAGITLLIALATARPVKLRLNVNLSLRIAPQLMAAVLLGPAAAAVAAAIGAVLGYLYLVSSGRANRTDLAFNTGQAIVSTILVAVLYRLVKLAGLGLFGEPLALLVAAEAMHVSNSFLVSLAIVLSGQSHGFARTFWRLITSHALAYEALLVTGVLGVLLARNVFWAVPLLAVPLLLVERTLLAERAETERQRTEARENERLYHEAQEALTLRDEFLRRAAHELKTPITNLLGYTQLLQQHPSGVDTSWPREQRVVNTIAEQGTRLHRLVVMLLDLSRVQTGQLVIDRRPVDLCALTERLVEESQFTLDPGTIHVTCPDSAVMIDGDELRLEQVVYNLLQNAIRYSPEGKTVEVRVARSDAHAVLEVTDNGPGIPATSVPQIFERFYQVPSRHTRQSSGFGIGLYIVKEIVVAHGGRIDVRSTPGDGSTFTVSLPCTPAAPPPPALPPQLQSTEHV